MYKMYLMPSTARDPVAWKNFLDKVETECDKSVSGFDIDGSIPIAAIDKNLVPYNATYHEIMNYAGGTVSCYLDFETEEDIIAFKLTYG